MGRNGEEDNVRIRLRVRLRQEYRTLLVFGHVQHRAVVAGLKENFGADVVVKESTVRQFPAQGVTGGEHKVILTQQG